MPCFDFHCPACGHTAVDAVIKRGVSSLPCSLCGTPMKRQFPKSVHSRIDDVVDGIDRGVVIKEKNERLKKMHAGYDHEQRALRKDITRQATAKLKGN